jgi:hypothetical protein
MPHGRLRYDIHARFAAYRCASARVGSRGPVADSVLIVGHAGMAAAVRVSARGSALRGDRRCCALSGGERGSKLAAGADAELGEDLPQVVGDGGGADEQLRGDLGVGGALADQTGDQRFLRGQGIGRLDGALPGVPGGGPAARRSPVRRTPRRRPSRRSSTRGRAGRGRRACAAGGAATRRRPGRRGSDPPASGTAEAVDGRAVQGLGGLPVADQRPRAGLGTKLFANPYAALCTDAGPPAKADWTHYALGEPQPSVCR